MYRREIAVVTGSKTGSSTGESNENRWKEDEKCHKNFIKKLSVMFDKKNLGDYHLLSQKTGMFSWYQYQGRGESMPMEL